ncbi:MAG: type 1 glutamine amidotransferase [Promethearchaeota archaeon]
MEDKDLHNAHVIVLEADGKVDSQHGYGYLIAKRLTEFKINAALVSIVENAQILETLPPKPLILSGGMTEVTADIDWIVKTKAFFRERIKFNQEVEKKNRLPTFGICFGAQLLVESYSKGSVKYLDDPEIGITDVPLKVPSHPIFQGYEKQFKGYTFHYNQIKTQKVSVLSSHVHKGHHFIQAFEIPDSSCFGVQFHPELNYEEMKTLLHTYKDLIKNLGLDVDPIIRTLPKIPANSVILKNFCTLPGSIKKRLDSTH